MNEKYTKQQSVFLQNVGLRIRQSRLKLDLSQEKFAQVCKLDRTYISDVERGERNISILNLEKIAKASKVPITQLIPSE
jgi:transcriptional regulator with XRE-family HTH domain